MRAADAPRPLVAGNWKMNGLAASLSEVSTLRDAIIDATYACDVMLCPPATLIRAMLATAKGTPIAVGGQDCHVNAAGAHTGDISAEMLADAGATAVIVGHSERRTDHGETDGLVQRKADAAHRASLIAIVCLGETEVERRGGKTLDVVSRQLAGSLPAKASAVNTVIAYEPVWAIGTGLTPSPSDVAEVHGLLRKLLVERLGSEGNRVRLLYGGSVKPANAVELMGVANVDGALVGGASLKAADFLGILKAYKT